jgi:hypothetical protein
MDDEHRDPIGRVDRDASDLHGVRSARRAVVARVVSSIE